MFRNTTMIYNKSVIATEVRGRNLLHLTIPPAQSACMAYKISPIVEMTKECAEIKKMSLLLRSSGTFTLAMAQ